MLTLAALAAPLTVAQAQTVLWEQTMTVGVLGGDYGWDDGNSYPGSALSEETFEYDGQTYDLSTIVNTPSSLELILEFNPAGAGDLATKATRDKLTFHVGTSAYNLGAAQDFIDGRRIVWSAATLNLGWSAGDMLALKITTTDLGAPGLTAMAGVAAVTLNWTVPTSSGGSAITGYEYRQRTGDDYAADAWTAIVNSASLTSYVVTGLTGGTAYTFQLRARNSSGAGVYSAEVTATPTAQAQVPYVLATARGRMTRTWMLPSSAFRARRWLGRTTRRWARSLPTGRRTTWRGRTVAGPRLREWRLRSWTTGSARNTLNKSVPGTLDLRGGSSRAERDDRGGGRWSR